MNEKKREKRENKNLSVTVRTTDRGTVTSEKNHQQPPLFIEYFEKIKADEGELKKKSSTSRDQTRPESAWKLERKFLQPVETHRHSPETRGQINGLQPFPT